MVKTITETLLSYKAGSVAAFGGFFTWIVDSTHWFNINLPHLAAIASFILILVMIITHVGNMARDNRKEKENNRKNELDIEEAKLRVELLRLELLEQKRELEGSLLLESKPLLKDKQ